MKIEVYAINLITKGGSDYLGYVELHEPETSGGEALVMRFEKTEDQSIHNRVMGNVLYVASFDENQIINAMQKFIDELNPTSWADLRVRLPKQIQWV